MFQMFECLLNIDELYVRFAKLLRKSKDTYVEQLEVTSEGVHDLVDVQLFKYDLAVDVVLRHPLDCGKDHDLADP